MPEYDATLKGHWRSLTAAVVRQSRPGHHRAAHDATACDRRRISYHLLVLGASLGNYLLATLERPALCAKLQKVRPAACGHLQMHIYDFLGGRSFSEATNHLIKSFICVPQDSVPQIFYRTCAFGDSYRRSMHVMC
jgi:hypothetical protein